MSGTKETTGDGAAPRGDVEVEIDTIRMNTQYPQRRVVVLKPKDAERYLYIVVGNPEADAIALKLKKVDVPRPMTHDLMLGGFGALGAGVRRVVVNDHRGETFYAQVLLAADGREVVLDCRPSDALALAVRAEAPIFVAESVLARCATDQRPETPHKAAEP